jgi:mannose/cellobiose epimerase-like protein (N-acyl-D-glucosamine 2-epimerase family)
MDNPWLEKTGLLWLHATDGENDFAEKVEHGVAVRDSVRTLATQARLGYCWSHLASLFPQRIEFARAAEKSFRFLRYAFTESDGDFRIYDQSFYLLFMAWYYRVTNDPTAIRLLMSRYSEVQRHFDDAGVGGFGSQPPGMRSHNPYMHLLEALLATFRATKDEYWLSEALKIEDLFFLRLLDGEKQVVFEFLNSDWSVAGDGRVEIGHQLEWSTLLLELNEIASKPRLVAAAGFLYEFALRYGFENGAVIDAVDASGRPMDRKKLLWSQMEAAKHFSVRARMLHDQTARARAVAQWANIRQGFLHANGWTWHNRIAARGAPVEEPSVARLLYHVVTAAAEGG